MPMFIRELAAKLGATMMNRRRAPRYEICVPIDIIIEPEKEIRTKLLGSEVLLMKGETKDLSECGIAFIVPSIRLREHYLVSEDRILTAALYLPTGKIMIKICGVRYEQASIHSSDSKYMIGARIVEITPETKEIYKEFLRRGNRQAHFEPAQNLAPETPPS